MAMDRYLIVLHYRSLNKKQQAHFDKLFDNEKLKGLIVKSTEEQLIMRVPLFDYLEFDFLNAKYVKKLKVSLIKRNVKTGKYSKEVDNAAFNSDEYYTLLRRIRL